MFETQESQLELFDVANAATPRPRREAVGRLRLHLRYDQVMLVGVAGVITGTVVFACGVERGKLLARAERSLLPVSSSAPTTAESPKFEESTPTESSAKAKPKTETTPSSTKMKTPTRVASASPTSAATSAAASRYAVQMASYNQPQLAKRELARLHARGERAFLVMREGRTVVYIGPFPSKGHASAKVADLKLRYQDCFIRSL